MNTITKALQSSQRDFGIVIKPTLVIVQIFVKELQDDTQNVYLQPGTLLKIIPNIQQDFVDDDDNKQPKKSNNNKNRNENSSYVIIQVLDYYNANPIWENVYKCNKSDIKPIGQDIWPYIIAITDPDDRALFISNTDRIRNCLYMKIGDLVTAWFIEIVYECEILYIGLIPEFGPGYYFGLRLLNYDKGYSPQTDKICKFAENYTKCDANQTLILSAISIFKTTNKELKKKTSSAKDLFCGTINRAKNVLGISTIPNNLPPEGVITRNSSLRNSSSKRNSSIKRYSSLNRQSTNSRKSISPYLLPNNKITKKTTANDFNVGGGGDGNQFSILSKEETEENTISTQNKVMENHNNKSNNNNNQKLSGQTVVAGGVNIPPSTSSSASSIGSTSSYKRSNKSTNTNFPQTNNETTIINQTTSQQHQQQNLNYNSKENVSTIKSRDKSIQIDDNLIQLENEEYARKIENYEKYIEQKNISSISTINSGGQLPVSILKQPKIGQITTNNNSNSSNSSSSTTTTTGTNNNNSFTINHKKKIINNNLNSIVKPNTIMSLEDRDIVIIDKADIKESTKNENSIIVLDNPRKDVDLVDLLGPNWPVTAGDAAQVLNTTTTINDQIMAKNISSGSNTGNGGAHIHSSSSNSSSVSNYSVNKNERNKSGNPLSHMARNISDRRNKENLSKLHQQLHNETGNLDNKPGEKKLKNTEPVYDNTNSISLLQHQKHVLSSEASSSSVDDEQIILPSPLNELPDIPGLGVGSMVEVSTDVCEDLYGVIRWIGFPNSSKTLMVGVELEDDPGEIPLNLTDGALNGKRLFKCPERRAFFIYPNQCSTDRRFLEIEQPISETSNGATGINTNNTNAPIRASSSNTKNIKSSNDTKMFGQVECPSVPGAVPPLKMMTVLELEDICGKFKGIQGHHNSCYLDATLFSMFTFTSVFDSLLFRPPEKEDISHYEEVQKVLREEIVNPLRKNVFVRADRVMKLRQLLEKLSSVSGLTCEEKDPEEFLNSLLAQILRADPFLKLSSGQDTFFYQLFVEKDERLSFPSVQQLFEQSFLASDIKLKEVPSCLIIQMPRFGKNFKMYPRILPSQVLDVTDIIEDSPRQCTVCGKLAEYECRECFGIMQCGVGLESTSFCKKCLETAHSHTKRAKHNPKEISVPEDFKIMAEHLPVPPRLFMELFAVVCIETSHYVSFVKAGAGQDAPWCFFDSMADRKGEQNGYNIPELLTVPDLPQWLSEDGARNIHEAASNDKMLPEHAKRLLCDAYMCMYQSTDVMMYR